MAKRSKKYLEEALYKRLFKDGSSEVSIRQQLNQFLKSSKRVYKWEVDHSLKILRRRNRYYPALKVLLQYSQTPHLYPSSSFDPMKWLSKSLPKLLILPE